MASKLLQFIQTNNCLKLSSRNRWVVLPSDCSADVSASAIQVYGGVLEGQVHVLGNVLGRYFVKSGFEAACTLMFQCYSGDLLWGMFRAELESLELDSSEMYSSTLEEIRVATQGDHALSVLCQFVALGWQPDKFHVPTVLCHYYLCREELAVYLAVF